MVDPHHQAVYRQILCKAGQLGDRRLERIARRKLQQFEPRPKERVISTPTGCVIIEFPAAMRQPAYQPPEPRRIWLRVLACLCVYPGSFLTLLMLTNFLT